MGLLQDLGEFLNEAQAVHDTLSDEFSETKKVIISSITDNATQISSTLSDTATAVSTTASEISDDIKQATNLPLDQPKE
jgi:hypothetical protein